VISEATRIETGLKNVRKRMCAIVGSGEERKKRAD
jgi:hypothetical protein